MKKYFSYILAAAFVFAATFSSCEKEEEPTYTVSFNSKGGTPAPQAQTVKKGGKVSKPADPTRENFNFAGWAKADNETSALWDFATETVTADMTLFARWTTITHAVTFDSDGGTAVPVQNVAHGGTATKPADPTRNGYEFDGWFNGETQWDFATAITAPITLKAKWTALHAVTFDSDGGSAVPAQAIRNGNSATEPEDPTRDGYEFDGWFSSETQWNFATEITAPITLKAKWTAMYTVTFDSDGGTAVPAQTIRNGNSATEPEDPTRNGYEFDGWFSSETQWNFATEITAPITLKAKWTAVYAVSFDSDGGSAVPTQIIRNGGTVTQPADPTKAWTAAAGLYLGTPLSNGNYTFEGWYNGETLWDFAAVITEPITLKAKWIIDFSLTRIESVSANDVPAAFTYANANSTGVEEYTLLLDANVIIGEQSMNSANVKLTIIGIGAERFITANSSNGRLFSLDGSNVNLTIGQNITLMGKSSSTHMIYVQRGSLVMLDGSKIKGFNTSNTSIGVVFVEGINAGFKMDGGEITENSVNGYSSKFSSFVSISAGGSFEMSGGSILGSNGTDVFIDDANCTFGLSGNAKIGKIMLYANNNTTRSTITIVGTYSGTVTALHLMGNGISSTIATYWTNAPVIINGSAGVISMFNNGGLGNFSTQSNGYGTAIRATHELNSAGVLVLK